MDFIDVKMHGKTIKTIRNLFIDEVSNSEPAESEAKVIVNS